MALMDFLSALGFGGGGGTGGSPDGLLGMTPDQTSALDALKKQAALKAIVPSLISAGIGYLGHPSYYGRGGAVLAGVRDAADTFQSSSTSDVNQSLQFAKMAQAQRRQGVLDAATLSRANDYHTNTQLHGRSVDIQAGKDAPTGVDMFAPFRNDPQYQGVVFPSPDISAGMTHKEVSDYIGAHVPNQLHNATMEALDRQKVAIAAGNEQIHAGEAASNENAATSHIVSVQNPDGTTQFTNIATDKQGNIVKTTPTGLGVGSRARNAPADPIKAAIYYRKNILAMAAMRADSASNPKDTLNFDIKRWTAVRDAETEKMRQQYALDNAFKPIATAPVAAPPGAPGPGSPPATPPAAATSAPAGAISLPPTVTTTSAALDYLTKKGMTREAAIAWIRANHG